MQVRYLFICLVVAFRAVNLCSAATEESEIDLFQAAAQGKLTRVQELVRQGVQLTITDLLGKTALHHAAERGQKQVVQFLLSVAEALHIPLIDSRDANGRTPLVDAVTLAQVDIVRILLRHGTDVNNPTDTQYAPLHLAACPEVTERVTENILEDCMRCHLKYFRFAEVVYLLIEAGVDIELLDMQRETSLYHAIVNKLHTVVRLLLHAGADVHAVDRYGASRLANALYESSKFVVYELLAFGVPIMSDARAELGAQGLDFFVESHQREWNSLLCSICDDLHVPRDIGGLITSFVVTQYVPTLSQRVLPAP